MAPLRSTWKGYLKLSLVSCPVKMFTAVSESERIRFNQLSGKTHNRVKQKLFDAVTNTEVPREDLVKGYEVGDEQYVVVTDADLDELQIEPTKTLELTRFVEAAQIDAVYYDKPYYLAPDGRVAQEPFRVITEALQRQSKVGLGRVVLAQKERLVALRPIDRGLVVCTLRSADEVRAAAAFFEEVETGPIDEEALRLAEHIIEMKTGPFEPETIVDRYQAALRDLVKAKLEGAEPTVARAREPAKVIDLVAALRRSLEQEGVGAKPPAPSRRRTPPPAEAEPAPSKPAKRSRKTG